MNFSSSTTFLVQVFGNGLGHVIHMGERECSIQRRCQKVIEETPSPFLKAHPGEFPRYLSPKCHELTILGIREDIRVAAVRLCQEIKYNSSDSKQDLYDLLTRE